MITFPFEVTLPLTLNEPVTLCVFVTTLPIVTPVPATTNSVILPLTTLNCVSDTLAVTEPVAICVEEPAPAFRANEAVVANDELIAWLALCAQLDVILYVPTGKNEAVLASDAVKA